MAQALSTYDTYLARFRALSEERKSEPAWLRDLRRCAIERFSEIGLPTARRGNERWKYTDVRPIAEREFSAPVQDPGRLTAATLRGLVPSEPDWTTLVFVDGRFAPALSTGDPGRVVAMTIADAVQRRGALVEQHLGRYAEFQDEGFIALNTALFGDGAFVHAPDGVAGKQAVHLVYVSSEEGAEAQPRTLVFAGRESSLALVESYVNTTAGPYLSNAVTEIVLAEGAQVQHQQLVLPGEHGYQVASTRIQQGRDSSFSSVSFARGAAIARNDVESCLEGEGSATSLSGLYLTNGEEHVDNYINIDHAAPHTTSRLFYKGILDGRSKAAFGGIVLVRPGAVKADAEQTDKNLLLSPDAEVNSKPSLEIYADDVRCSHGATAGAVTEDAIFYMQSRGLDEETAMGFLVKGFADEVIERVPLKAVRNFLDAQLAAALADGGDSR
ncbi:MAG TPA: Fe-S cluster assembly protein SufD [Dehalococcoidia bacterium]|nr:Fe-S cluster assembly protein SufD [Dehalococcoidia bacterium]